MMSMPKRLFFRYYGIYLIRKIEEAEYQEMEERKNKLKEVDNGNWQTL